MVSVTRPIVERELTLLPSHFPLCVVLPRRRRPINGQSLFRKRLMECVRV